MHKNPSYCKVCIHLKILLIGKLQYSDDISYFITSNQNFRDILSTEQFNEVTGTCKIQIPVFLVKLVPFLLQCQSLLEVWFVWTRRLNLPFRIIVSPKFELFEAIDKNNSKNIIS